MTDRALRVSDLSIRFGDAPGLSGVTFDVAAGERLVLLGASGSGKTTLLRAIAGLSPLAGGEIEIGGTKATHLPAERRDTVYLHQTPMLFPHLSVFENVAFPLRIRGVPEARVRADVERLLASVLLAAYQDRRPHMLSGGQRHRVALARAVAAGPKVLLLDEPLASLDPVLRDEVRTALLALQEAFHPALVIVTHDLEDAAVLGDRIGLLVGSTLAQLDRPEQIFRHPATLQVARFLGVANEVPGEISAGHFQSTLGSLPVETTLREGPAVAVFGADALRWSSDGPITAVFQSCRHGPERVTRSLTVGDLTLTSTAALDREPSRGDELRLALDAERVTVFPGRADV